MVRLSLVNERLTYLEQEFEGLNFELLATEGNERISCIICSSVHSKTISESWEKIVGLIAGIYQSALTNEFSKWNIYLVFFSKEPLDLALKYKIENNKFSMRKIVINERLLPSGQSVHEYLNSEILGLDLQLLTQNPNQATTLVPSKLSQLIESLGEIPFDQKTTSFEQRAAQLNILIERL